MKVRTLVIRKVKTKKTEPVVCGLDSAHASRRRRSATVGPDGVLSAPQGRTRPCAPCWWTTTTEGVISLPSGVFKPYAGVKTAIFFPKGGRTDDVFFDVQHDGYSL